MSTTRYFTGTATDGTTYNFVEEYRIGADSPSYRLSSLAGGYLTRVSEFEFTIMRSGITIRVQ
jgi:hypothetical protein